MPDQGEGKDSTERWWHRAAVIGTFVDALAKLLEVLFTRI